MTKNLFAFDTTCWLYAINFNDESTKVDGVIVVMCESVFK